MISPGQPRRGVLWLALVLFGATMVFPALAPAQEEVTSAIRRYRDR